MTYGEEPQKCRELAIEMLKILPSKPHYTEATDIALQEGGPVHQIYQTAHGFEEIEHGKRAGILTCWLVDHLPEGVHAVLWGDGFDADTYEDVRYKVQITDDVLQALEKSCCAGIGVPFDYSPYKVESIPLGDEE